MELSLWLNINLYIFVSLGWIFFGKALTITLFEIGASKCYFDKGSFKWFKLAFETISTIPCPMHSIWQYRSDHSGNLSVLIAFWEAYYSAVRWEMWCWHCCEMKSVYLLTSFWLVTHNTSSLFYADLLLNRDGWGLSMHTRIVCSVKPQLVLFV